MRTISVETVSLFDFRIKCDDRRSEHSHTYRRELSKRNLKENMAKRFHLRYVEPRIVILWKSEINLKVVVWSSIFCLDKINFLQNMNEFELQKYINYKYYL